jgi:hypothetical protein
MGYLYVQMVFTLFRYRKLCFHCARSTTNTLYSDAGPFCRLALSALPVRSIITPTQREGHAQNTQIPSILTILQNLGELRRRRLEFSS